jgi:hypothetical protein
MVVSLENMVFVLIYFVFFNRDGLKFDFLLMIKNLLLYCLNLSDFLFCEGLGVFHLLFAPVVKNVQLLNFQRDLIKLFFNKIFGSLACD